MFLTKGFCFSLISDGPSSTIGSCIMSALSIPPSQKTNISVGLESIHSYANVLNPVTFVGTEQYSVLAVYTEVEVGASEVHEEIVENAGVQVQTDFYEEEIEAMSAENACSEEAVCMRAEETSEAVDVAKALETLAKTFALRKESLSQDGQTGKSNDSTNDVLESVNVPEEERTHEETEKQRENNVKEEDVQPRDSKKNVNSCADSKDNQNAFSVNEDMPEKSPVSETQSVHLHVKTSSSWQIPHRDTKSSEDTTEELIM